jgi:hypothetical protein
MMYNNSIEPNINEDTMEVLVKLKNRLDATNYVVFIAETCCNRTNRHERSPRNVIVVGTAITKKVRR